MNVKELSVMRMTVYVNHAGSRTNCSEREHRPVKRPGCPIRPDRPRTMSGQGLSPDRASWRRTLPPDGSSDPTLAGSRRAVIDYTAGIEPAWELNDDLYQAVDPVWAKAYASAYFWMKSRMEESHGARGSRITRANP